MSKINIQLDLSKVDRSRITENRWFNSQGHEIIEKNYNIDVVPLKEPKPTKNPNVFKTHFVCEAQTKEERAAKKETKYMGSGFQFVDRTKKYDGLSEDDVQF